MRRVRPVWAVVAAASAAVIVASVVGSVATGMGWSWSWTQTGGGSVRGVAVARGGLHWHDSSAVPMLGGIPIIGRFFTLHIESPGWWFRIRASKQQREFVVPMWSIGLAAAAVGVVAWRRSRRETPGFCARCGYDLAGLLAGVCPECGTASQAGALAEPPRSRGGAPGES
ncbi:MAG: hypothetical protein KF699_06460 [Phycisphaeraceae bacterium]|nr:hypothetical protein [Phycisphaeraceae bacterium]